MVCQIALNSVVHLHRPNPFEMIHRLPILFHIDVSLPIFDHTSSGYHQYGIERII